MSIFDYIYVGAIIFLIVFLGPTFLIEAFKTKRPRSRETFTRITNDFDPPFAPDIREVRLWMPNGQNRLLWRAPLWKRIRNRFTDWREGRRRKRAQRINPTGYAGQSEPTRFYNGGIIPGFDNDSDGTREALARALEEVPPDDLSTLSDWYKQKR